MSQPNLKTPLQKEFYKNFERLSARQDRRKVWEDFITVAQQFLDIHKLLACNQFPPHIMNFYQEDELECLSQMFILTMEALEKNPDQDFLGDLYMQPRLSSHSRGEMFTPYLVCRMVSSATIDDIEEHIREYGWAPVCDPACGAGATLIAIANECSQRGINFQKHVFFVGQDISWTGAGMCFIQLSLLGCGGYVIVGNTLTKPFVGPSLLCPFEQEGQQIWYTPAYYYPPWSDWVTIDWLQCAEYAGKESHDNGVDSETDGRSTENHEEGGKDI